MAMLAAAAKSACPAKGINASCAQIGGCGHWCDEVTRPPAHRKDGTLCTLLGLLDASLRG